MLRSKTSPPTSRHAGLAVHTIAFLLLATTFAIMLLSPITAFGATDPLHPLGRISLQAIIARIISAILGLLGTLSLVVFVASGFSWMLSQGNQEKITKAKNAFLYASLGLIIAFSSYGILKFIMDNVIGEATGL